MRLAAEGGEGLRWYLPMDDKCNTVAAGEVHSRVRAWEKRGLGAQRDMFRLVLQGFRAPVGGNQADDAYKG